MDTTIKVGHKGPVVMALSGTWWPRGQCEEVSFLQDWEEQGTGYREPLCYFSQLHVKLPLSQSKKIQFKTLSSAQQAAMCNLVLQNKSESCSLSLRWESV